ncbi:MAG: hypothetical protein QOE90_244 [Thermoplasmata archaeon]|jgi:uncharacterized membrane protein (Fun14 family)|nr:hypothetical protein [Thermoplasmata archaeon]
MSRARSRTSASQPERTLGAILRRRFLFLFALGLGIVLMVLLWPGYATHPATRLTLFVVGLALVGLGGLGGWLRMR